MRASVPQVTKKTWVVVLLAATAAVASCRRTEQEGPEAAAPVLRPAVEAADVVSRPQKRPAGKSRPVIWIGLDGLDWQLLDSLSDAGKMPHWKRLTQEGSTARLASFYPLLSPLLWTSAATGVGPETHRVLDFQEVDPKSGRKVPISGRSREVAAVWNLASASGRSVGVVGWWATHPAEEVSGFFVSDHASPILYDKLPLSTEQILHPEKYKSGEAPIEVDLTPIAGRRHITLVVVAILSGMLLLGSVIPAPTALASGGEVGVGLDERRLADVDVLAVEGQDLARPQAVQ